MHTIDSSLKNSSVYENGSTTQSENESLKQNIESFTKVFPNADESIKEVLEDIE